MVFLFNSSKRPGGGDAELPKVNAVTKVPDWNWLIGTGVFLEDVDQRFHEYALEFAAFNILAAGRDRAGRDPTKGIYRSVGGEPAYVAETRVISPGVI